MIVRDRGSFRITVSDGHTGNDDEPDSNGKYDFNKGERPASGLLSAHVETIPDV